jgi:DNA-binding LacI/PurR family transcriptional regulator
MHITIKDIAALAKVSKGTVSRVINEGPGVGKQTRQRILKLIEELNYQPNAAAQGLAARRTYNIGVIIPHTGNYSMASTFWPVLLTAVTERAAAKNFNVLLSTTRTEEDVDSAYRSILRGRRVDGIVVSAEQFGQRQLAELVLKGFPFVMVGKSPAIAHYYVDVDNEGGAKAMTRHLIDSGHSNIVLLAGPEELPSVQERARGYASAMADAGLQAKVEHYSYLSETAVEKIKELLRVRKSTTALFAAAGDLVSVALKSIRELGLSIPSDLALVSFDDHPYFEFFEPPITAVSQPIHDLGQAAVNLLFALMEGNEPEQKGRILPTKIIERDSCTLRR